jgi:hypothetical protein
MTVLQCPHRKNAGNMPSNGLELAKEAQDFYVQSALTELAEEFKKQAEKINDG